MPDTPKPTPTNPQPSPAAPQPGPDAGHMPMGEEFDRARWTLPPVVPIVIALALVAVVVFLVTFTNRAQPVAAGAITKIARVDQQGNTMIAVQVKVDNRIEKQLWIKNITSELETSDGNKFPDHAAPSAEARRYLEAFPPLRDVQSDSLHEELKIPAGASFTGYAVFSYPVNTDAFDARKSLTVRIDMYDQPSLVIKQ
jgi:hypothetical protein